MNNQNLYFVLGLLPIPKIRPETETRFWLHFKTRIRFEHKFRIIASFITFCFPPKSKELENSPLQAAIFASVNEFGMKRNLPEC